MAKQPAAKTESPKSPPRTRAPHFTHEEDLLIVEGITAGLSVQEVADSLENRKKSQITGRVATMRRKLAEEGYKLPSFRGRRGSDYSHLYDLAEKLGG